MHQESDDQAPGLKERVSSNKEAQVLAREAAADVPVRRNRPAQATSKQRRKRMRKAYAVYNTLPKELQDNEYITTGYRVELSFWESVKSLFGLHNETLNIWTHLIGTWCCFFGVQTCHSGELLVLKMLSLLFRICTLPCAHNCHSLCQACTCDLQLTSAYGIGESAVHICTVQLGWRKVSLVKRQTLGETDDRIWAQQSPTGHRRNCCS